MTNNFFRVRLAVFLGIFVVSAGFGAVAVSDLRCENLKNPPGIDAAQPRLSWILNSGERGQKQTAYEILVASSENNLRSGNGDLWDSGKINSDKSVEVQYDGRGPGSFDQCFWKVRVWNSHGKASAWSRPALWTMGVLHSSDWHAQWIGDDVPLKTNYLADTSWIWFPTEGNPADVAPTGVVYFRRTIVLPADREVKYARFLFTGDSDCTGFVNGRDIGGRDNFHQIKDSALTGRLTPGTNVIAVRVENRGTNANPAGFVGLAEIYFETGERLVLPTDSQWRTSDKKMSGDEWQKPDFNDSSWVAARVIGPIGMPPWGNIRIAEDRKLPARWLRKEFSVEKKIRRATICFSGLGWAELYLNGKKVGDSVLSPGLTDYEKRVFYVAYDVTKQVCRGGNALGAVLGNGLFYSPRSQIYASMQSYGCPKMLLQLRIEFSDGTISEVVSDNSWKLTTDGPIRANNLYDGETYDARKELRGWSAPGFDDSKWQTAQVVSAPPGALVAQMINPIRVTQTLRPIAMTEPKPGVFIFDMGQNMVGWCRLHVSGPAGAEITFRHAETLNPDGTLYIANLRGARCTDTCILSGRGREVWEPRFTYHGFRYVEVRGFPGKPALDSIEGRVVNDDLNSAGEFVCSNPLLNRIYSNVMWGVRGNYHSVPSDCPQRDERQGWLGDRSDESKGESFIFDTEALYEKWLQDMADSQKPDGTVPDVTPPYWPIYKDNVTWPGTTVIVPNMLHDQFADSDIVARHYASAKEWMEHMSKFVTNEIISKDNYGDWCVPPEDPTLIHSRDTNRITNKALLATAYFYRDLRLTERYATMLGKTADSKRFGEQADGIKIAFNKKFLNRDLGQYDNGTQTSCVLPLAFGLAPDDMREKVFNHLVDKIQNETHGHIGTGLIGGQWLNRVLTDNGRPDVAYTIATQTTYPSWGYMVSKGATTIWELWNGDTADPAMNSGNHVMLVGDLVIWFYEDLAGIKSDPAQPGFRHVIMKPTPVGDLRFVKATHRSPFGLITSEWRKDGGKFNWRIKIPANTTATIFVPAKSADVVTESGRLGGTSKSVKFLRFENGRAVYEIGAGQYRFASR